MGSRLGCGRADYLAGVGCCSRPGDIWGWLWFSCGMAHCRGGLIAFFHGFFASIRGVFIFVGDWALGYDSMEFRHFCYIP